MNRRPPLPVYRARINRHKVPPRWLIAARESTTVAADTLHAREIVIGEAHRAAGVPPWKPCVRCSLEYTTAERTDRPAEVKPHDPRQLEIPLTEAA